MRRLLPLASLAPFALTSCVPARPVPPPVAAPMARVTPALPAAPPQQDWRDVPLTPGTWSWRGSAGASSIASYGEPGVSPALTVRCDPAAQTIIVSRPVVQAQGGATMTITTSFAAFTLAATASRDPAAFVAQIGVRDSRLDQIAFSRGRFLVDVPGQSRLVVPAWPEVARVIEDCRG